MNSQAQATLVLASTSQRRIDLLHQVGLKPILKTPDIHEKRKLRETAPKMVERLSFEKARAVQKAVLANHSSAIIIAADTTVLAPNDKTILNKPRDSADARRMLRLISGSTHTVYSGYCLLRVSRSGSKSDEIESCVRSVKTRVTIRSMSPAEIFSYVATGEPLDKAGSYAAQGLGMALIEKISGSYTNVVGLPMAELLRDLQIQFGVSIFSAKNTAIPK